ncbi:MAG: hypothetical protein RLZZ205_761 [Bacteroidota bacterium]|jgi:glycosyltransferase involved in cell wall biosynthesis
MTWVSVVIPCFNAGEDLRKAILSVLHQSYTLIELIIQDAGSTDPITISILQEFESECTIVVEKDNGIFDAFQKGIHKSKGEWIYLMGADDQLATDDVIQKLLRYNFMNQYDLIIGDVVNTHSISQWIPKTFHCSFNRKLYWRNTIHQQGCLYRKEVFNKYPLTHQFKILGDYHLHLQLYRNKHKALSVPLTFAVCKANGLSKQFSWPLYKEEMKIKMKLLPFPWNIILSLLPVIKYLLKRSWPKTILE